LSKSNKFIRDLNDPDTKEHQQLVQTLKAAQEACNEWEKDQNIFPKQLEKVQDAIREASKYLLNDFYNAIESHDWEKVNFYLSELNDLNDLLISKDDIEIATFTKKLYKDGLNMKGEKNAMSKIFTQERRFVYNPQTLSLEYYSGQDKRGTINLQNAKVKRDYQVIKIKPYGDGEARTYEISSNNKNKISALKRVIDHIPPSSELQDMNHIHQITEDNDDSQRSSEFQTESLTATL
jgi:hypothetical protein